MCRLSPTASCGISSFSSATSPSSELSSSFLPSPELRGNLSLLGWADALYLHFLCVPLPGAESGGEQAENVFAAGGQDPSCLHVPHPPPLRDVRHADHPEPGRLPPHGARHHRLQDQALLLGSRHLAQHPQLLFQRLVEHSCLQAHERLPQVWFLPGERTASK